MTMTKKQRRARGLDRATATPSPKPGRLPWKARDVLRYFEDGSSELLRWAVVDADGREIIEDFDSEELRNHVVAAVNLHRSVFGELLDPKIAYLDPMSILQDAVEILSVVLEEREEDRGKDPVLRDLVKRVTKAVAK